MLSLRRPDRRLGDRPSRLSLTRLPAGSASSDIPARRPRRTSSRVINTLGIWRVILVFALAAAVMACAAAAEPKAGTRCRAATPVDPSAPLGRAVPLGHLLWLAVYPFQSGYPTKTIVRAQHHPLTRRITIRGWRCGVGSRLRFWYRDGSPPFAHLPVTTAGLQRTGTLSLSFPRGEFVRTGYFMFWQTGRWKIAAYRDGQKIATAIVQASVR